MKNKLTQEQINYLFNFCLKQGIIHYDVQIEMVDHFTEWIETNWEKQPDASFLFMVAQLREAFPNQDLKEIVREKVSNLKKELVRHYKNEFISFFTLPKIMLSILLFVLFYSIPWDANKDIAQYVGYTLQIIGLYTAFHYLVVGKNIIRKNTDERKHPLLMYDNYKWLEKGIYIVYSFLIVYLIISIFWFEPKTDNIYVIYLIRTVTPLFVIALISYIHVSVRINKKIRELYPTAFYRT
ncbi:MAG: hypothetical protein ABL872_06885 [Lacibacter sp.]